MPLSNTERIARALFRHYLPNQRVVYNVRPEWAINPETGNALEYDLLFPDLRLAVEVNGIQHFRFTEGLQETFEDYQKQLRHDTYKLQAALANGYRFEAFSISQLERIHFEPFIRELMRGHGMIGQFQRTAPPLALYKEAERLSRRRVVPSPAKRREYRKPGLWPLLVRTWNRMITNS